MAVMPVIPRFAVVGALAALLLGGFTGLILGLHAYPPTAWFAVVEVGIPAAILGAIMGALVGMVAGTVQRMNRH